MKKNFKRSLSFFLTVCMFLSLLTGLGMKTEAAGPATKVEEGETLDKLKITLPSDSTAVVLSSKSTTMTLDTDDYKDSGLMFWYAMKGADYTDDPKKVVGDMDADTICMVVTDPAAAEVWLSKNVTVKTKEEGWEVTAEALRKAFNYDGKMEGRGKETFFGRHIYRLSEFKAKDQSTSTSIWTEGYNQAMAENYEGVSGYLTHITTKPENFVLLKLIDKKTGATNVRYHQAWIGARRSNGVDLDKGAGFKWMGGPQESRGKSLPKNTDGWGWDPNEPNGEAGTTSYVLTGWQGPYWDDHGDENEGNINASREVGKIIAEFDATPFLSVDTIEYLPLSFERNNSAFADKMDNIIVIKGKGTIVPANQFKVPNMETVFDAWAVGSVNGPKIKPGDEYKFTEATTLYALWKEAEYDITLDQTGIANGSASVSAENIKPKESVTVTISPTEGYEFLEAPTIKIENPGDFSESDKKPWEGDGENKELKIERKEGSADYLCNIVNIYDSLNIIVEGEAVPVIKETDMSGFTVPKAGETSKEYRDRVTGNGNYRYMKTFLEGATPAVYDTYDKLKAAYDAAGYLKDSDTFAVSKSYIAIAYHYAVDDNYSTLPLTVTGLPSGVTGSAYGNTHKGYSYVRFSLPSYHVEYQINGHGEQPEKAENLNALPSEFPELSETSYLFLGWYLDAALTQPAVTGTAIEADTVLYAKWEQQHYQATLNAQGLTNATAGLSQTSDLNYGEAITVTVKAEEGHIFTAAPKISMTIGGVPVGTEDPTGTEDPAGTEDPTGTEDPAATEDPFLPQEYPMTGNLPGTEFTYTITGVTGDVMVTVTGNALKIINEETIDGFELPKHQETLERYLAPLKAENGFLYAKTFAGNVVGGDFDRQQEQYNADDYLKIGDKFVEGKTYTTLFCFERSNEIYAETLTAKGFAKGISSGGYGKDGKAYIYVVFQAKANTFTVTYEENGHGIRPAEVKNTTAVPAVLPVLTEREYQFGGWYQDRTLKEKAVPNAAVKEDVVLYAKWTKLVTTEIKYPVVVADGTGSGGYEAGSIVGIQNKEPKNYVFKSWRVTMGTAILADDTSSDTIFLMPKETVAIKPVYVHRLHSVIKGSTAQYKVTTQADYVDGKYTKGGTVEYLKPLKRTKTVTIPDTVTIQGIVYKVTSIAPNAFRYDKVIQKMIVGDNVERISSHLFHGCRNLKVAELGTGVRELESPCFHLCDSFLLLTINSKDIKLPVKNKLFSKGTVKGHRATVESPLTVFGGKGSGSYMAGKKITLKNPKAPSGYALTGWRVSGTKAVLKQNTKGQTVLTMPRGPVQVRPVFGRKYKLTVSGGKGSGSYGAGAEVTLAKPKAKKGYTFTGYQVTSGKAKLRKNAKGQTIFTMPKSPLKIKAVFVRK